MKEYVLVECVKQFRTRYVIEVPEGKSEWALDTVVCNEADEFSQLDLGEVIVSYRVLSREGVLELCDTDNDYCRTWSDEKKIEEFVTTIMIAEK